MIEFTDGVTSVIGECAGVRGELPLPGGNVAPRRFSGISGNRTGIQPPHAGWGATECRIERSVNGGKRDTLLPTILQEHPETVIAIKVRLEEEIQELESGVRRASAG
jgi:hypothetical protein